MEDARALPAAMSDFDKSAEEERRLRNLNSVARHLVYPAEAPDRAAPQEPSRLRQKLAWLGSLGIFAAFVLGKLKLIIPLLKFAKFGTLLSMLVSVWAYALFWGFPFALGFVLLIFVHEMGHLIVMRQQGIRAGAPMFIPFVGAAIAMKSLPRNAYVEALVGIGGPVLGSVGALLCLFIGWMSGELIWYALANVGFLINLFNLIPISPLDGGRIVGVISRWLWLVGYATGIAVFLATFSPILLLILLLGLFNIKQVIRGPSEDYFKIAPKKRITIGVAYFSLIILLVIAMRTTEVPLQPIQHSAPDARSEAF
jgi:Zn-dependent protease